MAKTKAEIQREYEKRTGYAAQAKYLKERGKSVAFRLIKPQDNDIIEELKGIDIGNLTPMEALNTLYNLQNKIKNRW